MAKNKYCYAIVDKENCKILSSTFPILPIYIDKKMASDVVKNFKGFIVKPILLEDLETFLLYPDRVNHTYSSYSSNQCD